jgi:hypothetical protein
MSPEHLTISKDARIVKNVIPDIRLAYISIGILSCHC